MGDYLPMSFKAGFKNNPFIYANEAVKETLFIPGAWTLPLKDRTDYCRSSNSKSSNKNRPVHKSNVNYIIFKMTVNS